MSTFHRWLIELFLAFAFGWLLRDLCGEWWRRRSDKETRP